MLIATDTLEKQHSDFEEAQLKQSDPVLFALISHRAKQDAWTEEDYVQCFKAKRLDILAKLGYPKRKLALKFMRKISMEACDYSFWYNLNYWLCNEMLSALSYYSDLSLNHLKLFRRCPYLIALKWTYSNKEIAQVKDIQPLIEKMNAAKRKAEQINSLKSTLAKIHKMKALADIDAIHLSLNNSLLLHHIAKNKILYPLPPIKGNEYIKPIENSITLVIESIKQDNCAWTYHHDIAAGEYYMYEIIQPERATLGLIINDDGCLEIDQLLTKKNNEPSIDTTEFVQSWFENSD